MTAAAARTVGPRRATLRGDPAPRTIVPRGRPDRRDPGGAWALRLLLVEDNRELARWLAKILRGSRYAVDVAHDGGRGGRSPQARRLRAGDPRSRAAAARRARGAASACGRGGSTVPVIVLTANAQPQRPGRGPRRRRRRLSGQAVRGGGTRGADPGAAAPRRRPGRRRSCAAATSSSTPAAGTFTLAGAAPRADAARAGRARAAACAAQGRTLSKAALAEARLRLRRHGRSQRHRDLRPSPAQEARGQRGRRSRPCAGSATCCATMAHSLRSQLLAWVLVPLRLLAGAERHRRAGSRAARRRRPRHRPHAGRLGPRPSPSRPAVEDGQIQVIVPPAALEMFDTGAGDFVYYRACATAPAGCWPARRTCPLGAPERAGATVDPHEGGLPRPAAALLRARPCRSPGPDSTATVTVVVGSTLDSRDALVRRLWLGGFGQQLALLVTAGLFMVFGLKQGPGAAAAPARRGAGATERQPRPARRRHRPGRDAARWSTAINQQIERVQTQLAAQHRFVTNAAHQLRTPLDRSSTSRPPMRGGEPATAEQAAALAAIQAGTQQLSRLAGQLLTLSRAEPGSRRARADRVELGALARAGARRLRRARRSPRASTSASTSEIRRPP